MVTVKQRPEAMKVIEDACKRKEAPLFCPGSDKISAIKYGLEKQRFSYGNHKGLEITMAGIYQIENCALAVAALDRLGELGFPVKEEKTAAGPAACQMAGKI